MLPVALRPVVKLVLVPETVVVEWSSTWRLLQLFSKAYSKCSCARGTKKLLKAVLVRVRAALACVIAVTAVRLTLGVVNTLLTLTLPSNRPRLRSTLLYWACGAYVRTRTEAEADTEAIAGALAAVLSDEKQMLSSSSTLTSRRPEFVLHRKACISSYNTTWRHFKAA